MTEYIPWYEPAGQLVRCLDCGSLLSSGDTELHSKWHSRVYLMQSVVIELAEQAAE